MHGKRSTINKVKRQMTNWNKYVLLVSQTKDYSSIKIDVLTNEIEYRAPK